MKHFIRTIVCLLSIIACPQMYAGKSLVAYQGNAHVHLMLFDTDNPKKIIESVSISPDSDYRYLGNPTNIAFFDSPPKMLAYAVKKLLTELSSDSQTLKKLHLDHFGVFTAGYDVYAHELVCLKAEGYGYADEDFAAENSYAGAAGKCLSHDNGAPVWLESKENFFWRTFAMFNHQLGQAIEASHMLLKGDHHLITQAARVRLIREKETYELIDDVDVVHTTTCAPGYQVRDGLLVEGSAVSPHIGIDGGFHQVGRGSCARILKPALEPFKADKIYTNAPVVNALQALPIAREYATYRNDSILNRWKNGFSNELGIAIITVLKEAALPENDENINSQIQEELIPLIVGGPSQQYTALQAVAQSITKLENKGYVILPDGKKNRIRLLGEFPWDELGLKSFFRYVLPERTYNRLEFIIAQDYEPMLTIAASYIYQHPELVSKNNDAEDDE